MQRALSLILVGNYGAGNAGDDALRDAFLAAVPDAQWRIISAAPGQRELSRLPAGIRSFMGLRWVKTLRAIRHADAMIFGGGTLLTDIESPKACFLWWLHARTAALFGVPVLFAAQGIGPFHTALGRWFALDALRRAAFLSVRDSASARRVESLKLNTKIVQTSDPVFLFFSSKKDNERTKKVFVIIPRGNSTASFRESAMEAVKEADSVRIVLLQPGDPAEQAFATQLQASIPGAEIVQTPSMSELADALQDAAIVITQRYHGAIAAIGMGIPCRAIPQAPGDKIDEMRPVAQSQDATDRQRLMDDAAKGMHALRSAIIDLTSAPQ